MTVSSRLTGFSAGAAMKSPCYVATTGANITLSATQTVDGLAVGSCERVLVMDQTDATENGVYLADSSTWTRAQDFDGAKDAVPGSLVYVRRGSSNGDHFFALNASSTALKITIGTDNSSFSNVTVALAGITAEGQLLIQNTSAADMRSTLGLAIGTDVQAFDQQLADLAGITPTTGALLFFETSSTLSALAIGTSGQVITSTGDLPKWLTLAAIPAQATQAAVEAETNEDTYTPPDLLVKNPGVAKAWVNGDLAGGSNASYNITMSDNGTGDWTATFGTDFSAATYAHVVAVEGGSAQCDKDIVAVTKATGSCRLNHHSAAAADNETALTAWSAAFFGDQ